MSLNNPFAWKSNPRPSVFATDPKFAKGAATGLSMGQIQSATVDAITKRTGRNPGTLNIAGKTHAPLSYNTSRKKRG
jgi:hypothetical protein